MPQLDNKPRLHLTGAPSPWFNPERLPDFKPPILPAKDQSLLPTWSVIGAIAVSVLYCCVRRHRHKLKETHPDAQ